MPQRYGKDRRSITVPAGATFEVDLPSTPTAGYEWSAASAPCVDVVRKEVIPASSAVGGGAVERFTLRARSAGVCTLTFVYRRAWEQRAQDTVRMAVQVR